MTAGPARRAAGAPTMARKHYRNEIEGYLFLAPQLLGLVLWLGIPMLAAFALSFTHWDLFGRPEFVGLRNYINLLFHDRRMWATLFNTAYFTAGTVTLGTTLALLLAAAVHQVSFGQTLFKSIYFLPVICSMTAIAALWRWLFSGDFGLLNLYLERIGISAPDWLNDTRFAMPAVILMSVWKGVGFPMIIFLAGLHDIPAVYYEAAEIDGADRRRQFLHVTLPQLSPIILFVVVTSVIGCFQTFDQIYMMTSGGPMGSTRTIAFYLFENAFVFYKFGNACAIAYVLFVLLGGFTHFSIRLTQRWVHYQ